MIETFTIIAGLLALISVLRPFKHPKTVFWAFTIALILFDGMRWEMGTDWRTYFAYFAAANERAQSGFEPGFLLYTSTVRGLTDSYSAYLLLTTAIIYSGIFYSIFRMTQYSFFALFYLAGMLPWYSGSLRQMLATVFFTFAFKAAADRKLVRFIVFILVGTSFHTTALVFLPMYWLVGISWSTFAAVFVVLSLLTVAARNLIALLEVIVATAGFEKSFTNRLGGTLDLSNPLFGFLRKILTIAGFAAFVLTARTSPKVSSAAWQRISFAMMLVTLSIILYYLGTYSITYASSRLDIYVSIISGGALVGLLDTSLEKRENRILLLLLVASLVFVFYSRLEEMSLFHPYSSVFFNADLHRDLY